MNQRDWELLDKELWGVNPSPPRHSGMIALTIVAVFLIGMALGGFLFPHESKQVIQVASYDGPAPLSYLNGTPPTAR